MAGGTGGAAGGSGAEGSGEAGEAAAAIGAVIIGAAAIMAAGRGMSGICGATCTIGDIVTAMAAGCGARVIGWGGAGGTGAMGIGAGGTGAMGIGAIGIAARGMGAGWNTTGCTCCVGRDIGSGTGAIIGRGAGGSAITGTRGRTWNGPKL